MALQSYEQLGTRGMEEVVRVEVELVGCRQRDGATVDLGERDRAVERDDRRGAIVRRRSYSARIWCQSVSAAVVASLCTALIAAWIW
jgi:hypothetical protein